LRGKGRGRGIGRGRERGIEREREVMNLKLLTNVKSQATTNVVG
jgi:hypothetical protein